MGFYRKSSVFTAIDFSKATKTPTNFTALVAQQSASQDELSPAVKAEQKRLASKYGIQTFDRYGNITFDGTKTKTIIPKSSKSRTTRYTPRAPKPQKQIAPQKFDIPSLPSSIPEPQQILPPASAEPTSDLVAAFQSQQDGFQGPKQQQPIPTTLSEFAATTQQQPRQQVSSRRLAQISRQRVKINQEVEVLTERVNRLADDMFSEANRLRAKTGNSNINIENEAELLDLSNRYKGLWAQKQEADSALTRAEDEQERVNKLFEDVDLEEKTTKKESVSLSGIGNFNPMEVGGQLTPVVNTTRSPEETAIRSGNSGTIIDPNFDLNDVRDSTKGVSPLNIGIPTVEGIPSINDGQDQSQDQGQGGRRQFGGFGGGIPTTEGLPSVGGVSGQVDEIQEIDAATQRLGDDELGTGPERIIMDPIEEQLQSLRGSVENIGQIPVATAQEPEEVEGPQQPEQFQEEQEPDLEILQEQQQQEPDIPQQEFIGPPRPPTIEEQASQAFSAQGDAILGAAEFKPDQSEFSQEGQGILSNYSNFQQGADVFQVVPGTLAGPDGPGTGKEGNVLLTNPNATIPSPAEMFNVQQDESELPDAPPVPDSLKQPKDDIAIPYAPGVPTEALFLGAQDKLGEQGYLDYFSEGKGGSRTGPQVQGFLGPATLGVQKIQGIDRNSEEGAIISNIYARQAADRYSNAIQQDYVGRLRKGEVSIRDALLNPSTRTVFSKDGNITFSDGIDPKRKVAIETYFTERGISLDEAIGAVQTRPVKFTLDEIKSAVGLDSLSADPSTFRKTLDGQAILANPLPLPGEISEAKFRRTLSDIINVKDSSSATYSLSQDQQEEVSDFADSLRGRTQKTDSFGTPLKDTEGGPVWAVGPPVYNSDVTEFVLTYTGPQGKLNNKIVNSTNLELELNNIVKSPNTLESVSPFDGERGLGPSLGNEQVTDIREQQEQIKAEQKVQIKDAIDKAGLGDIYPWMVAPGAVESTYNNLKTIQSGGKVPSLASLPPGAAGAVLGAATLLPLFAGSSVFAALPTATPIGPVQPVQSGIVTVPPFSTPGTITIGEQTPPPLQPTPITADFFQDPAEYARQVALQTGEGLAYPITNIAVVGSAIGEGATKPGGPQVLEELGRAQYGETILDRYIEGISAGFEGFETRDINKRSYAGYLAGGENVGVLESIAGYLGGIYDQTIVPLDEKNKTGLIPKGSLDFLGPAGIGAAKVLGEYDTRFDRGASPAFRELYQDIKEKPVFYAASTVSEVGTFVLPPLLGMKAVSLTAKGAAKAGQAFAIASVVTGAGGGGVSLSPRAALAGLKAGKLVNPITIKSATKGQDIASGTKLSELDEKLLGLSNIGKSPKQLINEEMARIAVRDLSVTETRIDNVFTKADDFITTTKGAKSESDNIREQARLSSYISSAPVIKQRLTTELEQYAVKKGVITRNKINDLKFEVSTGKIDGSVNDMIIDKLEVLKAKSTPAVKLEIDNKINSLAKLDTKLDALGEQSLFYRDPLTTTSPSIYNPFITDVASPGKIPSIREREFLQQGLRGKDIQPFGQVREDVGFGVPFTSPIEGGLVSGKRLPLEQGTVQSAMTKLDKLIKQSLISKTKVKQTAVDTLAVDSFEAGEIVDTLGKRKIKIAKFDDSGVKLVDESKTSPREKQIRSRQGEPDTPLVNELYLIKGQLKNALGEDNIVKRKELVKNVRLQLEVLGERTQLPQGDVRSLFQGVSKDLRDSVQPINFVDEATSLERPITHNFRLSEPVLTDITDTSDKLTKYSIGGSFKIESTDPENILNFRGILQITPKSKRAYFKRGKKDSQDPNKISIETKANLFVEISGSPLKDSKLALSKLYFPQGIGGKELYKALPVKQAQLDEAGEAYVQMIGSSKENISKLTGEDIMVPKTWSYHVERDAQKVFDMDEATKKIKRYDSVIAEFETGGKLKTTNVSRKPRVSDVPGFNLKGISKQYKNEFNIKTMKYGGLRRRDTGKVTEKQGRVIYARLFEEREQLILNRQKAYVEADKIKFDNVKDRMEYAIIDGDETLDLFSKNKNFKTLDGFLEHSQDTTSTHREFVLYQIAKKDGLTNTELSSAYKNLNAVRPIYAIQGHHVNTALKRLSVDGFIDQRNGKWYLTGKGTKTLGSTTVADIKTAYGSGGSAKLRAIARSKEEDLTTKLTDQLTSIDQFNVEFGGHNVGFMTDLYGTIIQFEKMGLKSTEAKDKALSSLKSMVQKERQHAIGKFSKIKLDDYQELKGTLRDDKSMLKSLNAGKQVDTWKSSKETLQKKINTDELELQNLVREFDDQSKRDLLIRLERDPTFFEKLSDDVTGRNKGISNFLESNKQIKSGIVDNKELIVTKEKARVLIQSMEADTGVPARFATVDGRLRSPNQLQSDMNIIIRGAKRDNIEILPSYTNDGGKYKKVWYTRTTEAQAISPKSKTLTMFDNQLEQLDKEVEALRGSKKKDPKLNKQKTILDNELNSLVGSEEKELLNLKALKSAGETSTGSGNINSQIKILEKSIANKKQTMAPAYKMWGEKNIKLSKANKEVDKDISSLLKTREGIVEKYDTEFGERIFAEQGKLPKRTMENVKIKVDELNELQLQLDTINPTVRRVYEKEVRLVALGDIKAATKTKLNDVNSALETLRKDFNPNETNPFKTQLKSGKEVTLPYEHMIEGKNIKLPSGKWIKKIIRPDNVKYDDLTLKVEERGKRNILKELTDMTESNSLSAAKGTNEQYVDVYIDGVVRSVLDKPGVRQPLGTDTFGVITDTISSSLKNNKVKANQAKAYVELMRAKNTLTKDLGLITEQTRRTSSERNVNKYISSRAGKTVEQTQEQAQTLTPFNDTEMFQLQRAFSDTPEIKNALSARNELLAARTQQSNVIEPKLNLLWQQSDNDYHVIEKKLPRLIGSILYNTDRKEFIELSVDDTIKKFAKSNPNYKNIEAEDVLRKIDGNKKDLVVGEEKTMLNDIMGDLDDQWMTKQRGLVGQYLNKIVKSESRYPLTYSKDDVLHLIPKTDKFSRYKVFKISAKNDNTLGNNVNDVLADLKLKLIKHEDTTAAWAVEKIDDDISLLTETTANLIERSDDIKVVRGNYNRVTDKIERITTKIEDDEIMSTKLKDFALGKKSSGIKGKLEDDVNVLIDEIDAQRVVMSDNYRGIGLLRRENAKTIGAIETLAGLETQGGKAMTRVDTVQKIPYDVWAESDELRLWATKNRDPKYKTAEVSKILKDSYREEKFIADAKMIKIISESTQNKKLAELFGKEASAEPGSTRGKFGTFVRRLRQKEQQTFGYGALSEDQRVATQYERQLVLDVKSKLTDENTEKALRVWSGKAKAKDMIVTEIRNPEYETTLRSLGITSRYVDDTLPEFSSEIKSGRQFTRTDKDYLIKNQKITNKIKDLKQDLTNKGLDEAKLPQIIAYQDSINDLNLGRGLIKVQDDLKILQTQRSDRIGNAINKGFDKSKVNAISNSFDFKEKILKSEKIKIQKIIKGHKNLSEADLRVVSNIKQGKKTLNEITNLESQKNILRYQYFDDKALESRVGARGSKTTIKTTKGFKKPEGADKALKHYYKQQGYLDEADNLGKQKRKVEDEMNVFLGIEPIQKFKPFNKISTQLSAVKDDLKLAKVEGNDFKIAHFKNHIDELENKLDVIKTSKLTKRQKLQKKMFDLEDDLISAKNKGNTIKITQLEKQIKTVKTQLSTIKIVPVAPKQGSKMLSELSDREITKFLKLDKKIKSFDDKIRIKNSKAQQEFGAARVKVGEVMDNQPLPTVEDLALERLPKQDIFGQTVNVNDPDEIFKLGDVPNLIRRDVTEKIDPLTAKLIRKRDLKVRQFDEPVGGEILEGLGSGQSIFKPQEKLTATIDPSIIRTQKETKAYLARLQKQEKQAKYGELLQAKDRRKKKKSILPYIGIATGTGSAAPSYVGPGAAYASELVVERAIQPPGAISPLVGPRVIQQPPQPTLEQFSSSFGFGQIQPPKDISIGASGVRFDPIQDSRLKATVVPKQAQRVILNPLQDLVPRLSLRLDVTPKLIQKPKTDLLTRTKPRTEQRFVFPIPVPQVRERIIPRGGFPLLPPPPFWLAGRKKRRKKVKPKKSKKAKLLWQVPDVWFGKYDPREYVVVKGGKGPRSFQTGNWGFDTDLDY